MDWLLSPAVVLSIVVASLYGGLFHVLRGRKLTDFVLYWLASLIGFGLGQVLGNALNLGIMMIGLVHIVEASAISWVALLVARWLKQ